MNNVLMQQAFQFPVAVSAPLAVEPEDKRKQHDKQADEEEDNHKLEVKQRSSTQQDECLKAVAAGRFCALSISLIQKRAAERA